MNVTKLKCTGVGLILEIYYRMILQAVVNHLAPLIFGDGNRYVVEIPTAVVLIIEEVILGFFNLSLNFLNLTIEIFLFSDL